MPRVLVCDDHAHVRRVLQMKLEQSGFEVRTAADGRAALAAVADFDPQVLVTDITMPDMGGRELCQALLDAGRLPALRVLVVTSRRDRDVRAWFEALPGVSLLEKPLSPKQVRDWIAAALGLCTEVRE